MCGPLLLLSFMKQRPHEILQGVENAHHLDLLAVVEVENAIAFTDQEAVFRMDGQYGVQGFTPFGHALKALHGLLQLGYDAQGGVRVGQLILDVIVDVDQVAARQPGDDDFRHGQTPSPSKASSMDSPPSLRRDSTPLESSASSLMVACCFS